MQCELSLVLTWPSFQFAPWLPIMTSSLVTCQDFATRIWLRLSDYFLMMLCEIIWSLSHYTSRCIRTKEACAYQTEVELSQLCMHRVAYVAFMCLAGEELHARPTQDADWNWSEQHSSAVEHSRQVSDGKEVWRASRSWALPITWGLYNCLGSMHYLHRHQCLASEGHFVSLSDDVRWYSSRGLWLECHCCSLGSGWSFLSVSGQEDVVVDEAPSWHGIGVHWWLCATSH